MSTPSNPPKTMTPKTVAQKRADRAKRDQSIIAQATKTTTESKENKAIKQTQKINKDFEDDPEIKKNQNVNRFATLFKKR
jgi:hypothetical protein